MCVCVCVVSGQCGAQRKKHTLKGKCTIGITCAKCVYLLNTYERSHQHPFHVYQPMGAMIS